MYHFTFKNFMRKARLVMGLSALGLLCGVMPVHAQSSRDMANRLDRIENEIQTLNRAVYRGEKPSSAASNLSADPGTQAGIEVRLQQLETELRDMRGAMEEQAHEVRQLRSQMERLSGDLDVRLGDLERGGSVSAAPSASSSSRYTANPIKNAAPQQENSDGFQWQSQPQDTETAAGGETTSRQLGTITQSPSGVVTGSEDAAAAAYENAFSLLKNARYDQAETEFQNFLSQYPGHVLSGNAQYWMGESLYVRGKYEQSARIFAEGYQKYPEGAKAADNLLKLGMSLAGLGNKQDACVAFGQLKTQFGNTSSNPVIRRAEQEMTRLGCA